MRATPTGSVGSAAAKRAGETARIEKNNNIPGKALMAVPPSGNDTAVCWHDPFCRPSRHATSPAVENVSKATFLPSAKIASVSAKDFVVSFRWIDYNLGIGNAQRNPDEVGG